MRPVVLALSLTLLAATFTTSASALLDPPVCFPLQDDAGSGLDAPNGRSGAVALAPDGTYEGCGDRVDNQDWYTFDLAAGDMLRLTVVEEECSRIRLDLHEQGSESWAYYGRSDRNECGAEVVGVPALDEDKTLELNVRTLSLEGGDYTLTLERGPHLVGACGDPQDDGGSGTDAGYGDALNLTGAVSTAGCIDEFDGEDWYGIPAEAGDRVTVTITPQTCGAYDMLMGGGASGGFDYDYSGSDDIRCGPWTTSVPMADDGYTYVGFYAFLHGTAYDLEVVITPGGA